jgi:hypothetical protein
LDPSKEIKVVSHFAYVVRNNKFDIARSHIAELNSELKQRKQQQGIAEPLDLDEAQQVSKEKMLLDGLIRYGFKTTLIDMDDNFK